ncbi:MAG TPA: c-type cytochrome [Burkholderiales bacterium]|nr:c-type cytochrome [Burkholderiales bacterium]
MTEKRYATNVWTILGISVVLMLFIFLLVGHHHDIPDRVRLDRGALLGTGSSVAERIKPVDQVNVASAETQREPAKNLAAAPPPSRDGQQVYRATCVACHDAGIAGAPKLGDKSQWAKHIAKGFDALYASALNGVQGAAGAMPPKGGNPALSDAEVRAAVDYMVARSK